MSNQGIMKNPERSRQFRSKQSLWVDESLTFNRSDGIGVTAGRDSFLEKRSIASRAGNFIMTSSIGSTILGSPLHQGGDLDDQDLTFNRAGDSLMERTPVGGAAGEERQIPSFEKSPIETPRSEFSLEGNELEMLEELPEHETTFHAPHPIAEGANHTAFGSVGSEEQFVEPASTRCQRKTIKLAREERAKRNSQKKSDLMVENIDRTELELESKLLELGKTNLPTMQNWHMNIDAEGLAEHFPDGRSFDKFCSIESLDDQSDKRAQDEIIRHPNVLDDSFVQIEKMNN